jgi:hypothetical protein
MTRCVVPCSRHAALGRARRLGAARTRCRAHGTTGSGIQGGLTGDGIVAVRPVSRPESAAARGAALVAAGRVRVVESYPHTLSPRVHRIQHGLLAAESVRLVVAEDDAWERAGPAGTLCWTCASADRELHGHVAGIQPGDYLRRHLGRPQRIRCAGSDPRRRPGHSYAIWTVRSGCPRRGLSADVSL